jgi:hypothetical protein
MKSYEQVLKHNLINCANVLLENKIISKKQYNRALERIFDQYKL